MKVRALTRFALPWAIAVFVAVAVLEFPDLPARVVIHFDAEGRADRWTTAKKFIALNLMTAMLLAGALMAARYYASHEQVEADHPYAKKPGYRDLVVVLIDVFGASGLLLVSWMAHHCVQASRHPETVVERWTLVGPILGFVIAALVAAGTLRARSR